MFLRKRPFAKRALFSAGVMPAVNFFERGGGGAAPHTKGNRLYRGNDAGGLMKNSLERVKISRGDERNRTGCPCRARRGIP